MVGSILPPIPCRVVHIYENLPEKMEKEEEDNKKKASADGEEEEEEEDKKTGRKNSKKKSESAEKGKPSTSTQSTPSQKRKVQRVKNCESQASCSLGERGGLESESLKYLCNFKQTFS